MRSRQTADVFEATAVVERVAAYETAAIACPPAEEQADPELVERAAMLLAVMPRNQQRRRTIEELLCPNDVERGRKAVDALIAAALAVEDDRGHLRRLA